MPSPLSELRKIRLDKLKKLQDQNIEGYPSSSNRSHTIKSALKSLGKEVTIVGRLLSLRSHGKIIFGDLTDSSGQIQILFKSDGLDKTVFENISLLDIGDFLEVTGKVFVTNAGQTTVDVKKFRLLAKSLLPIPSEYYGLADIETRLRKRYLDILINPEVKDIFIKKNKFWSSMRQFLVNDEFLEVEMPILENIPGGAEAEPFVTHHNALDRDFYLRISLELPLKKMLVAGYEKVFEIGRIFRNEGIDAEHLQDYTQMEFYWAYGEFDKLMDFTEKMYQFVIKETFGTLKFERDGQVIDWSRTWPKLEYLDLFKKYTNIDLLTASDEALFNYAKANKIAYEKSAGRGRIIDLIFKKKIRILPEVSLQPAFLINPPVEIEPLAKKNFNNPKTVQRMQILAFGSELGKGFGELNDPIDQRERFENQMKLRENGDNEAQMIDEDYIEAMEYGMPPSAGFGVSERLFSVLMGLPIRETVIFPLMKEGKNENE